MVKRAVLAGCNYVNNDPNEISHLAGCVNDVLMAHSYLIKRFKFDPADIHLMYDDGNDGKQHKMPTTKNIIAALKDAIALSKPGDLLYFHYSGHGSYQHDKSGDEKGDRLRRDEYIIGTDLIPLVDDYLRRLIAPLPDGVKFVFISDSCYSGTMLDQPTSDVQLTGDKKQGRDQKKAVATKPGVKARCLPPDAYKKAVSKLYKTPADFLAAHPYLPADRLPKAGAPALTWDQAIDIALNAAAPVDATGSRAVKKPPTKRPTVNNKDLVLLSGCTEDQVSEEVGYDGGQYGALSLALALAIKSKKGVISYLDAAQMARNSLAEWKYEQNPTLTCDKAMSSQPYLGMAV